MKVEGADSKLYLLLFVLGLTAGTGTKATALGTKQDRTYEQDPSGAEHTDNRADGPPKEDQQLPYYYYNNFDCSKHQYVYGMYADMDFRCQVYHVCHNNRKETFVCPQGTLFNQRLLVCDHWYSVNCQNTPSFYYVNEELGKPSNRTRFDGGARPYPHRRFPQEYGHSYATEEQGQFPPYHGGTTQLPIPQPETPRDQTGRYYPQPPPVQTSSYGQPQPDRQSGSIIPGYGHQPPQGEQDAYRPRRPTGVYGGQPPAGFPGTQTDRATPTRYDQRRDQSRRSNTTWPADQRNATGFQYGGRSSRRYGQNYPENSLLGARYGGHGSVTAQRGQRLPDRSTSVSQDGSPFLKPTVSRDGSFGSQLPPSGLTDNRLPSPGLREQRPPGPVFDRGYGPGFPSGRRDREETLYGQQGPRPVSPGVPESPRHPFTTHGGEIDFHARRPGSAFDQQQPTEGGQRPPQPRRLGSGHGPQHSTFPPQYGGQPHFGSTRGSSGTQNQTYTTSSPVYGGQPVSPDGRLSPGRQQGDRTINGQGPQYVSQVGVRGTEQNFTPGFAVYESRSPGSLSPKPGFGYRGQSLNRQQQRRPGYNLEESAASDRKQGLQHGGSDAVQRPQPVGNQYGWQRPRSPQYSFQQPRYRNLLLSPNVVAPHSTPGGDRWTPSDGAGNEAAQLSGGEGLKPILVYQRRVPVATNGNNSSSIANGTAGGGQELPVYKAYYVRGDRG